MRTKPDTALDETALKAGRQLFSAPCRFMLGVADLDQLPPEGLPEIAFAGRSNVGKSSLLNALVGRHNLARTSNTPGRTQQLNFFDLDGRLILVDLPGYGFAKVPKALVKAWTEMLTLYLRGRVPLRRACVLIDSRHGLKPPDIEMMDMLDTAAVPYRIVLTKADKIKPPQRRARHEEVAAAIAKRPAAYPEPLVTSAETGEGIDALRAALSAETTA